MTCRRVVELLGRYLAGDLGRQRHRAVEDHLASCADCVAYLTTYAAAVEAARTADRQEPATSRFTECLVSRVLAALSGRAIPGDRTKS